MMHFSRVSTGFRCNVPLCKISAFARGCPRCNLEGLPAINKYPCVRKPRKKGGTIQEQSAQAKRAEVKSVPGRIRILGSEVHKRVGEKREPRDEKEAKDVEQQRNLYFKRRVGGADHLPAHGARQQDGRAGDPDLG
jgi:hypothetical protein